MAFHVLRDSGLVEAHKLGKSRDDIQKMAGHVYSRTTDSYLAKEIGRVVQVQTADLPALRAEKAQREEARKDAARPQPQQLPGLLVQVTRKGDEP
jgi:hypothetical protein